MGLLDLPAPVLTWIEAQLNSLLPPVASLAVWAAAGALVSMELYRALSPQQRLTRLATALKAAQRRLAAYDGDFKGAWPLMGGVLGLALRRIVLVLPATLAATLPLIVLVLWLDTRYGRAFPAPGQPVAVSVAGGFVGRWDGAGGDRPPRIRVLDGGSAPVAEVTLRAPVPVVHKRRWWNLLAANPAGYLPDEAPVERIEVDLPRREMHGLGPPWTRRWEPVFILAVVAFAVPFKIVRRIA